ncbi:uncharacterized protein [Triticum aestivum]|uniref:uncharacterized protein n=1 Tax=Triticum aestivum TaxID=4565 RepID=UPI001D031F16|nr:uncharacterized protein LOC123050535 [Triticum aestivum]
MDPEKQIKFMTYNVWSRDDIVVYRRMQGIGRCVEEHQPDVIFFQEITPYILKICHSFSWWKDYHCSPISLEEREGKSFCIMLSKVPMENHARWKFTTTATGKSYLEADIIPGLELGSMTAMKPIRIATTQLEPPCPPESVRCMERYTQAEHSMAALSSAENVVFGGDMSWDDNMDLPFPLPAGWVDAWTELRSLNQYSWTYNSFWAEKIGEFNGYRAPVSEMKKRSDRFVCKLQDYTLKAIDLIEDKGLGICYVKKYKRIDLEKVELMRSCHRGLVLTIVPNEPLSSAQQHG